jgi:hypothetical protein
MPKPPDARPTKTFMPVANLRRTGESVTDKDWAPVRRLAYGLPTLDRY